MATCRAQQYRQATFIGAAEVAKGLAQSKAVGIKTHDLTCLVITLQLNRWSELRTGTITPAGACGG